MSNLNVPVHLVWGTRKRRPHLNKEIRQDVFDHIREYAQEKGIYILAINGHIDHVHALVSLSSIQTVAEVVKFIKGESSFWINKNKLTREKFQWQRRYWGMAIGLSEMDRIKNYINRQEEHHRNKTYREEVEVFIEKYNLETFDDN